MENIVINPADAIEMRCAMKEVRIAVCDDEAPALRKITKRLDACMREAGVSAQIISFTDAKGLLESLVTQSFEAFFLDIDMPEKNGIDLAQELKEKDPDAILVFVSAREEFVFESFRVHPFAFVRKGRLEADLARVTRDLAKLFGKKDSLPVILEDELGHSFSLDPEGVFYLEAMDKYVQIVSTAEKKLVRSSLKKMEGQLAGNGFLRCHKSYLVNVRKIFAIQHDRITLENGEELPLRRGQATELKKEYAAYMGMV